MKDKPAFPLIAVKEEFAENRPNDLGMTLREYYAGLAMQGLLAANTGNVPYKCAENAIIYADALIKELEVK